VREKVRKQTNQLSEDNNERKGELRVSYVGEPTVGDGEHWNGSLTLKSTPLLLVQVQLAATRTFTRTVAVITDPRLSRAIKTLGSLTYRIFSIAEWYSNFLEQ
jgi:hypothetical protein